MLEPGSGGEQLLLWDVATGNSPSALLLVSPSCLEEQLPCSSHQREPDIGIGGRQLFTLPLSCLPPLSGKKRRVGQAQHPIGMGGWTRCFPADRVPAVLALQNIEGSSLWLWVGDWDEAQGGDWELLPPPPELVSPRLTDRESLQSSSDSGCSDFAASPQPRIVWEDGSLDAKFHATAGQGSLVTAARSALCFRAALLPSGRNSGRREGPSGGGPEPGDRPALAVAVWSRCLRPRLPSAPDTSCPQGPATWRTACLDLPTASAAGPRRPQRPQSAPPAGELQAACSPRKLFLFLCPPRRAAVHQHRPVVSSPPQA